VIGLQKLDFILLCCCVEGCLVPFHFQPWVDNFNSVKARDYMTILTATIQPLNRQISEWERVIKYYHYVTIIEPQYNYLASKDLNGSKR
jgi:hypothetical protein